MITRRGACCLLGVLLIASCARPASHGSATSNGPASTTDLRRVASDWADNLDVRVLHIDAVRTTDTRAHRLLTGTTPDRADVTGDRYWLVQVRADGAFDCECSFRGPGPRFFDYLVRISDRSEVPGPFLLTDPVRLASLGTVRQIHP